MDCNVSLTTSKLHCKSMERQYVNEWGGSVLIKLYLQNQVVGWIWPKGNSLQTLESNTRKGACVCVCVFACVLDW